MALSQEKIIHILNEHKRYFSIGQTKNIDFRIKQLKLLKGVIKKNEDLIIEALRGDLHKPEFETYATEIGYLYDSINYTFKNLKKWVKVKKVKTPIVHLGAKSYIYPEPYGTVLIIGPFNYPFQLVIEPLIGAIAAGNCVAIKPSEYTPNVSRIIEKIIIDNFNQEYISVILGGKEITTLLINYPFDYIFFTGSVAVGKFVMEAAAKNLVPVTLELGGKSPCIVHKDCNLKIAARRIVWGKFINVGQTCVAPDYILVHRDIKMDFIGEMIDTIKDFYGDNPKNSKDYGRIVNKRHTKRIVELIDAKRVVYGGDYDLDDLYVGPTIIDNVNWTDKIMEDEIFGPILPIIEYEDIDEIIDNVNNRSKPLALYLFTENKKIEDKVINSISYGGGCINDTITHLATPFLPFGGVGSSGIGSYHGEMSFKTFSHMKSILKRSTRINLSFIYPPYLRGKLKLLRSIMK